MNPRAYPDNFDEMVGRWSREYGSTGIKLYELEQHAANRGCVAAYREMSLQERALLARLEEIDAEAPGAFDYMRLIVSNCLLYPSLEAYPHPTLAAGELFPRIRQHGHGELSMDEELLGSAETGFVPDHMATDMRNARSAAAKLFNDPRYGSIYRDIALELAVRNGQVDPILLDHLWRMPPGRIRELAAHVEQVYILLRQAAVETLSQIKNEKDRLARAQSIEAIYTSPFAALDEATAGAAIPGQDASPEEDEEEEEGVSPLTDEIEYMLEDLPPNL